MYFSNGFLLILIHNIFVSSCYFTPILWTIDYLKYIPVPLAIFGVLLEIDGFLLENWARFNVTQGVALLLRLHHWLS